MFKEFIFVENNRNNPNEIIIIPATKFRLSVNSVILSDNILLISTPRVEKTIENPKVDGREIALTQQSLKILEKLNVWNFVSKKSISAIKEARVLDGDSKYFLNFAHEEIKKECLGYIVSGKV